MNSKLIQITVTALFLAVVSVCFPSLALAQFSQTNSEDRPLLLERQLIPKTFTAHNIKKNSGLYSRSDWSAIIDSTWGPGLPTIQKLQIFDTFWNNIDWYFACFQDLDVNWDSLKKLYRKEIENNVSRGRFAAIMNYLTLALKESHTICEDNIVNRNTFLDPGIPLLYAGGWGLNNHFGACLTPLPDSSLLVYKSVPNHPIGLVPGDIVLGYDNVPWNILYKDLIAAQLPITGSWWGCSNSAYEHSWLMSAGMNWHLFDTLDVVKYSTGDTLHYPTTALIGQTTEIFGTEQMEIPGVPIPDPYSQEYVSWGIISGTNIGYIYVMVWAGNAGDEFLQAVNDLAINQNTTGLIIDFRTNFGGNMFLSTPALEVLFNTTVETVGFACRSDPNDHLAMEVCYPPSSYSIYGDSSTYYDKPIAVLTGPGAVSSGDQVALRMQFHPRVKIFGKPTSAAFNGPTELNLGNSDWNSVYARADAFLVSNPGHYLTHDEFVVDEEVWLTQDDVANGYDTVVETAINWITLTTPVELTYFTGTNIGSSITLNWTTATETNNLGFEVQRSTADSEFITVGFVEGNGTTTEEHHYSFKDKGVSGFLRYRLKQVDFDGSYEYSNIIEVKVLSNVSYELAQNFPNPFNPTTTISYTLPLQSHVKLSIYNPLGELVETIVSDIQSAGEHEAVWNAGYHPSGVYIYTLGVLSVNGIEQKKISKKMLLLK